MRALFRTGAGIDKESTPRAANVKGMDIVGGLLQVLFMLLSFALWLLPVAFAVWVLQRLSAMSRDVSFLTRQLAAIAEHNGAPVVTPPPAPRRQRAPLWAFGIVLALFLLVIGGIYVVPGLSSGTADGQLVPMEGRGRLGGGSATMTDEVLPMPEPVQDTPGG